MSQHIKDTEIAIEEKETKAKKTKRRKLTKKQKKSLLIAGCVIMALLAILLALYPLITNYINQKYNSTVITEYDEIVAEMDTSSRDLMLAEAQAYNNLLVPSISGDIESSAIENEYGITQDDYYNILNVNVSGLIGYLEIPSIDVYIPIYHGTSNKVLQSGAGHVEGTSFPVGGESTHAVISAHSGLSTQKMFTDLEDMEIGDIFYVHVLDMILAYEVAEINIVLPEEVEYLEIESGEDKVTLITCYPYAVNTHRLLVTGYRTEYVETAEDEATENVEKTSSSSKWMQEYLKGLLGGLIVFVVVLAVVFIILYIASRKKKKKAAGDKHGDSSPISTHPDSDTVISEENSSDGEQVAEIHKETGEADTKLSQEVQK